MSSAVTNIDRPDLVIVGRNACRPTVAANTRLG